MARYFIEKDESFLVVCPFDIRDENNPQPLLLDPAEIHAILKSIPEDRLEFQWIKFRRCDWGLDCALRELAYSGSKSGMAQDRQFSPERFNEVRIRFLTMDSSFLALGGKKPTFSQLDGYSILSADCEILIKSLGSITLGIFLRIAAQVWDYGIPASNLMSEADYREIRKDPKAVDRILKQRAGIPDTAIVKPEEAEKKETKP